jgi:hypothetical protein
MSAAPPPRPPPPHPTRMGSGGPTGLLGALHLALRRGAWGAVGVGEPSWAGRGGFCGGRTGGGGDRATNPDPADRRRATRSPMPIAGPGVARRCGVGFRGTLAPAAQGEAARRRSARPPPRAGDVRAMWRPPATGRAGGEIWQWALGRGWCWAGRGAEGARFAPPLTTRSPSFSSECANTESRFPDLAGRRSPASPQFWRKESRIGKGFNNEDKVVSIRGRWLRTRVRGNGTILPVTPPAFPWSHVAGKAHRRGAGDHALWNAPALHLRLAEP